MLFRSIQSVRAITMNGGDEGMEAKAEPHLKQVGQATEALLGMLGGKVTSKGLVIDLDEACQRRLARTAAA